MKTLCMRTKQIAIAILPQVIMLTVAILVYTGCLNAPPAVLAVLLVLSAAVASALLWPLKDSNHQHPNSRSTPTKETRP